MSLTESIKKLPVVLLEAVLAALPAASAAEFKERVHAEVTFGDATYTLLHADAVYDMLGDLEGTEHVQAFFEDNEVYLAVEG